MSKDSDNPNAIILGTVAEGVCDIVETVITFPWKTALVVLFVIFSLAGYVSGNFLVNLIVMVDR